MILRGEDESHPREGVSLRLIESPMPRQFRLRQRRNSCSRTHYSAELFRTVCNTRIASNTRDFLSSIQNARDWAVIAPPGQLVLRRARMIVNNTPAFRHSSENQCEASMRLVICPR
jgi:hypothetical protein